MPFFGGGGASVDLASPSAIGSTTPNTGAFTTLSFAPSANSTGLTSSSYSLTGSNAQSIVSLSGTWNTTGTPTGILLNITDTASNSASKFFDLQTGGTSRFAVFKNGVIGAPSIIFGSSTSNNGLYFGAAPSAYGTSSNAIWTDGNANKIICTLGNQTSVWLNTGYYMRDTMAFGFLDGNYNNSPEIIIVRDSSNVIGIRRTTNAQSARLYKTYTDASNYERLSFVTSNSARLSILSQNAGTGTNRPIEISFYASSSDPTSTDITDGCFSVWKNSGTGTIKLWANDGGTMKSVSLA